MDEDEDRSKNFINQVRKEKEVYKNIYNEKRPLKNHLQWTILLKSCSLSLKIFSFQICE